MVVNEVLKFLRKFTKKNRGGRGDVRVEGGGVRVDVNEELMFLGKLKKKKKLGGGFGGGGRVGGGQGGCERRIEVFVKIQKKKFGRIFFFFLGGGGRGSGWTVRVDVIEELKLLRKFT